MSALHTTSSRHPSRIPAVPPVLPPAGDSKPGKMESQIAIDRPVDLETKQLMIAEAAYYCAEKRGFETGHELEDWLEAEARIEAVPRK